MLFTDGIDSFDDEESKRHASWVEEIEINSRAILAREGRIVVPEHQNALFGRTTGLAWETHLLKALRRLSEDGTLSPRPMSKNLERYEGSVSVPGRQ